MTADTRRKLTRSEIMSRIRGKDTKPEIALRKALWRKGLRGYRKNAKKVPGKPDVCWQGRKVAVFVDSCFWHGCPAHFRQPKTNAGFWRRKIARNKERDREVSERLRGEGWLVIRLWTHLPAGRMAEAVRRGLEWRERTA